MKWSSSGTDFAQAPVGTHVARCIKVIDIGTQKGEYKGAPTFKRQCIISFELPTELMDDGKPFIVSRFYTASLSERSNLRHHLEMWRGRAFTKEELLGFDSSNILGKPCMLTIMHTEKGKARIESITSLPKGMQCPPQFNKSVIFSLDEFVPEVYESLSDGLKRMIELSPEYAHIRNPAPHGPMHDDDSPDDFEAANAKLLEMESDIPF